MRIYKDKDCAYCNANPGMCPPHEASSNCESNHYNHCTCDRCF